MLLNMTIANFKSVKSPQKISFEALRDNRLPESKVVVINDKLKAIKTSAIIGPNGAGKSSFVRALEVLNRVVTSPDENENPLAGALSGTVFAYGVEKTKPAEIEIEVLLSKGDYSEENPTVIARYRFVANKDRIYEETLYHIVNGSKKLMFERKYVEGENAYAYRYGKMYRGEKKRLAGKIADTASFLGMAARKCGETCSMLYSWFTDSLHILPMGVSSATENYIAQMLTKHPSWREQLSNFFWAVDITDIRRVGVREDGKVVFTHVYINDKKADGYSNLFTLESLSLRRLTALTSACCCIRMSSVISSRFSKPATRKARCLSSTAIRPCSRKGCSAVTVSGSHRRTMSQAPSTTRLPISRLHAARPIRERSICRVHTVLCLLPASSISLMMKRRLTDGYTQKKQYGIKKDIAPCYSH